jgi:hypothetical protein
MRKRLSIFIIAIIIGITAFLLWINTYVVFKPLVFENGEYRNIVVDTGFKRGLTVVLGYENIVYKQDSSGNILIKRKVKNDKELIWNLTVKAADTAWLNSHEVPSNALED